MKKLIKLIIISLSLFVFSTPVFANEFAHTINYMVFYNYAEAGISVSVTTNFDTDEGARLYLAIYSDKGFLHEVVSEPLDQILEDERHVYRMKITSVLDETMMVKAFILNDMMPCAIPVSVQYNNKLNSESIIIDPETKDYIYVLPGYVPNTDDINDKILDNSIPNTNPGVESYPVIGFPSTIIVPGNGEIVDESYNGIHFDRTPIENNTISLDEYGNLIYNNN